MSEADEEDAGVMRARRLREQIERLRQSAGPGGGRSSPSPASPRDFTDAAAALAAEEGKRAVTPENMPGVEGVPDGAAGTTDHDD